MDETFDKFVGVLTNAANAAVAARYQQPFELEKLKMEAIANGRFYPEGYPVGGAPVSIPSGLLLVGGAVVVYLLLKG